VFKTLCQFMTIVTERKKDWRKLRNLYS